MIELGGIVEEELDICPIDVEVPGKTTVGSTVGFPLRSETRQIEDPAEWRMTKATTYLQRDQEEQMKMIQTITGGDLDRVCVDSGAGESVCPVDGFSQYPTRKMDTIGVKYRAACGQRLTNVGEKRPRFNTTGQLVSMTFQATTDVEKPLAAASTITPKGNRIVSDGAGSDSYIEHKKTGTRIPLKIENGVYMMEMFIEPRLFRGRRSQLLSLRSDNTKTISTLGNEEVALEGEKARVPREQEFGIRNPRKLADPKLPTKKDVDEHELSHLPYRSWCRYCVEGKGKVAPHLKQPPREDG